MRYLFCAVGTNGDILPLLAVAAELCKRGHRVTMVAGRGFSAMAESLGVEYVCISSSEEHEALVRDKQLLSTRYAFLFYARHSVRWNQLILEAIESRLGPELMIITSERSNVWADLLARRYFSVPVIRALIDLPNIPELVPPSLPRGRVQQLLEARTGRAWSHYLGRRGMTTTLNHIYRVVRAVRPSVPTIALWPEWVPDKEKLCGLRGTFGFMPLPGANSASALPRAAAGGHIVFVAGTEGTTAGWLRPFRHERRSLS